MGRMVFFQPKFSDTPMLWGTSPRSGKSLQILAASFRDVNRSAYPYWVTPARAFAVSRRQSVTRRI